MHFSESQTKRAAVGYAYAITILFLFAPGICAAQTVFVETLHIGHGNGPQKKEYSEALRTLLRKHGLTVLPPIQTETGEESMPPDPPQDMYVVTKLVLKKSTLNFAEVCTGATTKTTGDLTIGAHLRDPKGQEGPLADTTSTVTLDREEIKCKTGSPTASALTRIINAAMEPVANHVKAAIHQ